MKLGVLVVFGSVLASAAFVACSSSSETSPDPVGSGSAPKKGSAGGFSASLTAELSDGSGSSHGATAGSAPAIGSGAAMAGSGSSAGAMTSGSASGSASASAGSGSGKGSGSSATAMVASGSGAGSGSAKSSGGASSGSAGSGSAGKGSAAVAMAGSGAGSATNTGGNLVPPPAGKGSAATQVGPTRPADNRHHVNPPADLAAIKIDLEPNWDRDFDEAGTISFVLKVPNGNDTRLFSFKYGYDLANAPADRESYKKFLSDQKVLTVTLDRQRGAAWYLEGTDGTGAPAFRYLVLYGGKRLVCGGVLYKDKESTALGPDLRDKVVAAAKKICETLQL